MKTPRFLSTRFAAALALGCALLAFAAAPGAAQAQVKVVALDNAALDKLGKFVDAVNADPDKKAAIDELDKDSDLAAATSGGSINDLINTKHPKTAAVFKGGGYTPDEFMAVVLSVGMASAGMTDGTSDAAIAKANVEFVKANQEKVNGIVSKMK